MIKEIKKKLKNLVSDTDENIALKHLFKKYKDFTMIPEKTFYANLRVSEQVKAVQGSIVECGVWRGGMMAGIAELLGKDREYFLFDSFEGLPEAKEIDGESARAWQEDKASPHYFNNCKAEMEYAQNAMGMSGGQKVKLIKGWFSETLIQYDVQKPIALLRLDCDWYDSVTECLETLYPLVTKGGVIIIDDYFTWDGCSIAVHDFLSKYKLPNRIISVEKRLAYIIK